ncbi:MAG: hypothetical protein ACJA0N_001574 [Pseudohongiellaceae bacterium]|jgi:uncharacterized protein YgiM (DUF1202 family)
MTERSINRVKKTALFVCFCLSVSLNVYAETDVNSQDKETYFQAAIAEPYLEIRQGPGRGYAIFYVAERGETISILKSKTDWYQVKTQKGIIGWTHANEITLTLDDNGETLDISVPSLDGSLNKTWETSFIAGDFEGNDAVGIMGGYYFNQNLSAEISYIDTFGDTNKGQGAFINLTHQPFPQWRASPFFSLGGGVYKTNPKANLAATKSRDDNVSFVATGARIYLAQRLFLRLQYTNYLLISDRDDDEEVESWTIGISAFY